MKNLKVKRKAYTTKTGKKVKATTYYTKDRGKKGRAKKVLPPLKKGRLGISYKNPTYKRRSKLITLTKKIGERRVVGRLRAIQILNKNTNPKLSLKAKRDAAFINKTFKGKKQLQKK